MTEKILKPSEVEKMVSDRTGGAAFPTYLGNRENWDLGMTLRDYFAAQALIGLMEHQSALKTVADANGSDVQAVAAAAAYDYADAMLEARQK